MLRQLDRTDPFTDLCWLYAHVMHPVSCSSFRKSGISQFGEGGAIGTGRGMNTPLRGPIYGEILHAKFRDRATNSSESPIRLKSSAAALKARFNAGITPDQVDCTRTERGN